MLQARHGHRRRRGQRRHASARQHRIVIIAIAAGKLLVVSARHAVIAIIFGHAAAPVHGVGNFVRPRIKLDLLLEILLGFVVAVLAIGQPGALPMRIRSLVAVRKALVDLAVVIDGACRSPCAADTCCRRSSGPPPAMATSACCDRMCSRMLLQRAIVVRRCAQSPPADTTSPHWHRCRRRECDPSASFALRVFPSFMYELASSMSPADCFPGGERSTTY